MSIVLCTEKKGTYYSIMIPYAKQTVNLEPLTPSTPKKVCVCAHARERKRKEHEKQLLSGEQCNANVMQESGSINENGKASTINANKEKHKAHMQNAE